MYEYREGECGQEGYYRFSTDTLNMDAFEAGGYYYNPYEGGGSWRGGGGDEEYPFTLPEDYDGNATKFVSNVLKFTMHFKFIPWQAPDDESEYGTVGCHVQFMNVDDTEYYSYLFLTSYATIVGVVGLLGFGSFYGFKNRRCCVQSDLEEDIDDDVTDFVYMGNQKKESDRV